MMLLFLFQFCVCVCGNNGIRTHGNEQGYDRISTNPRRYTCIIIIIISVHWVRPAVCLLQQRCMASATTGTPPAPGSKTINEHIIWVFGVLFLTYETETQRREFLPNAIVQTYTELLLTTQSCCSALSIFVFCFWVLFSSVSNSNTSLSPLLPRLACFDFRNEK